MSKILVLVLACFAASSAYKLLQDAQGHLYYLVPTREKRQTSIDVSGGNPGTTVTASHRGNILDSDGHRLDGGALISKQFHPSGPVSVGGQLEYTHEPSGSNLNLGAQHSRFGTDVSATGTANLWRNGNSRLDAVGTYGRHFGGPGGTSSPDYYGGLQFTSRF